MRRTGGFRGVCSWRSIPIRIAALRTFFEIGRAACLIGRHDPAAVFTVRAVGIDLMPALVVPFLERDMDTVDVIIASIAPPQSQRVRLNQLAFWLLSELPVDEIKGHRPTPSSRSQSPPWPRMPRACPQPHRERWRPRRARL